MALAIKGSAFRLGKAVEASDASFANFFEWLKNKDLDSQWPFVQKSFFCKGFAQ